MYVSHMCGPLKRSFHSRFKLAHSCKKNPIYTRTRQINYYYSKTLINLARLPFKKNQVGLVSQKQMTVQN
jgi:hypothetical protein